jgi:urease accessory protein
MEADTFRMRVKRPFVFTNLKSGEGVDRIASFVIEKGGLTKSIVRSGQPFDSQPELTDAA